MDVKRLIPFLVMPLLLLAVEVGSILISLPVQAAGITAFEDPTSLANPFIFILILLVFTGFLLLLIKYRFKKGDCSNHRDLHLPHLRLYLCCTRSYGTGDKRSRGDRHHSPLAPGNGSPV